MYFEAIKWSLGMTDGDATRVRRNSPGRPWDDRGVAGRVRVPWTARLANASVALVLTLRTPPAVASNAFQQSVAGSELISSGGGESAAACSSALSDAFAD
jgi:hypothetical protein